jgi:hypothetical protein
MTSILMIGSALEVALVVAASVIFLAMIVAAVAVIIWAVAGVLSATHEYPAAHH